MDGLQPPPLLRLTVAHAVDGFIWRAKAVPALHGTAGWTASLLHGKNLGMS